MLKLSVFVSFCLFDCLFVLNVPTTAKVISRRGHSLNSHLTSESGDQTHDSWFSRRGIHWLLCFDKFETTLYKYD